VNKNLGYRSLYVNCMAGSNDYALVSPVNGPITLPTGLEWKSSFVQVGRLIHLVKTE
jgi:hypothetical protein